MVALSVSTNRVPIGPIHAIFLAFPFPMFLATLVSDFAYWGTYQIQWSNFSSWLIVGGLIGNGFAILCALIDLIRFRYIRTGRTWIYLAILVVMFVLGFINALVHAKDAWAIMPESLYLSAITTILALVAAWIGYTGMRPVEVRHA